MNCVQEDCLDFSALNLFLVKFLNRIYQRASVQLNMLMFFCAGGGGIGRILESAFGCHRMKTPNRALLFSFLNSIRLTEQDCFPFGGSYSAVIVAMLCVQVTIVTVRSKLIFYCA